MRTQNWLIDYVSLLTVGEEGKAVDLKQTRQAIFAEPYFTEKQDERMWSTLADPTDVEVLLKEFRTAVQNSDEDMSPSERDGLQTFLDLPYETQVTQLRSVGILRPLYDPSVSKHDVDTFLQTQHLDSGSVGLLAPDGITVKDEFVPDLQGSITGNDVYRVPPDNHRFSFRDVQVGGGETNDAAQQKLMGMERTLFQAYGRYQANLASREEERFMDGEIDLEGKEPTETEEELNK
uniref:Uncharacterized protein n=1 Tax=Proboscia inermis TaxID=420281 RepID=A0A7S0CN58_9STRA|mmetsp:Transcript_9632/g.9729  ORF Transcript_9632/g.9729 Transcript_9632/m.9729 type:complete len:235 (+) Transcript_9632:130-834(+)